MTKVIGLTGGIGSGKTTVTQILKDSGLPIIDTDILARQVVEPKSIALKQIRQKLGKDNINTDGTLNRALLRQRIFNDSEAKLVLESILHPLIQAETVKAIEKHKKNNPKLIVVAIPLLAESFEKNGQLPSYIDEVWTIVCSLEQQLERASKRDNSNKELIQKIIEQQASPEARLKIADHVIVNNGSVEDLKKSVKMLLQ
ncbi:MAG TPA: dephospho-CoA kinase [Thiomicrospira sp.]|jgi:dephospho-CoA kinase|nr:dephospho-CoA kinase [Thiomicrospira sp.]